VNDAIYDTVGACLATLDWSAGSEALALQSSSQCATHTCHLSTVTNLWTCYPHVKRKNHVCVAAFPFVALQIMSNYVWKVFLGFLLFICGR